MDSENGNKILGIWISIFLDFGFWRDFGFSPQENSNSKLKNGNLGLVTYLSFSDYRVLWMAPSASASGITAMATRAYMPRYGNGSNTREMSRYHSSRGEEVSSPRVGLC